MTAESSDYKWSALMAKLAKGPQSDMSGDARADEWEVAARLYRDEATKLRAELSHERAMLQAANARLRALETVAEHATGRCDCKRVDDCHVAIHKALGRTE